MSECSACNGSGKDDLGMVCVECMGKNAATDPTTPEIGEVDNTQADKNWEGMNESQGRVHAEGYESPAEQKKPDKDDTDPWDRESQEEIEELIRRQARREGVEDSKEVQTGTKEKADKTRLEDVEKARKQRAAARKVAGSDESSKTGTKKQAKKKESRKIEFSGDGCPFMNARCEGGKCSLWISKRGCGIQVAIKTIIYRLRTPKKEEKKNGTQEKEEGTKPKAD